MAYLIDTDILIASIKANPIVNQHIAQSQNIPKALSIITYGELLFGAKKSTQSGRNSALIYRLAEIFPIIGISRAIIETFADIKLILKRAGERIPDMDLLIASTALSLNYTLVTNNVKHFRRIKGLSIENWME
jgi:tRNA(fMet)-specific endonuclease VapC